MNNGHTLYKRILQKNIKTAKANLGISINIAPLLFVGVLGDSKYPSIAISHEENGNLRETSSSIIAALVVVFRIYINMRRMKR